MERHLTRLRLAVRSLASTLWAPLAGMLVLGLVFLLHAQTESPPALFSTELPPELVPDCGTFHSAQLTNQPPLPYDPFPDLPVYVVDAEQGVYLIDDRFFDYEAWWEEQAALLEIEAAALGLSVEDLLGGGAAYGFTSEGLRLLVPEWQTNQALLTIAGGETNGIYDLYFRTNMNVDPASTFSMQWSRIQRTAPGQTNLVVTNLLSDQGFFRLGPLTNAIRPGFDQHFLAPNDDNRDPDTGLPLTNLLATLPFAIDYFGSVHTNLYVNNNGNVTLDGTAYEVWTPYALASLGRSIIAPFWGDVDTTHTNSDVVRYGTNTVDGHRAFGVGWVNVGYFWEHADKLLSCQLVIIDRSDVGTNDFDMEFNYDKVEWQWGDYSPDPPRAGYADGGTNSYELPGSGITSAFLDTNLVTGLIYYSMDGPRTNLLTAPVSGRYRFYFRNGEPLP